MENVLVPLYRSLLPRDPCEINGRQWPGLKGGSWDEAWSKEDRQILFADGSFIEIKSYDQDIKTFEGPKRHIIAHDEEPPQPIFNANMARQIALEQNLIFAFTPLDYSQWLWNFLYLGSQTNKDIELFAASHEECDHVNEQVLASIEANIHDPAERAARLKGEWTYVAGRILKEYGDHNLVEPFKIPSHFVYSLIFDPHDDKPTAWNLFADDPHKETTYVVDEGNEEGDVELISKKILARVGHAWIENWACDPSSRRRGKIWGKEERLFDLFSEYFPSLIEANNNVVEGIDALRNMVKQLAGQSPRFRVFKNCVTTHHQLLNWSWRPPKKSGEDRRKPEVYKKFDDNADCCKYKVITFPITLASMKPPSQFKIKSYANE